jgi:hypothetical protein
MKKIAIHVLGACALLVLSSGVALADGTVWVYNNSSVQIPQTRVYKNCLTQSTNLIFSTLGAGQAQSLTRTGTSADSCMWGREVGIEPYYISCNIPFLSTNDPAVVTLEWRGTAADNLYCVMCEQGPPCP